MKSKHYQYAAREKIVWRGDYYEVPDADEIMKMLCGDYCTNPEGEPVEPDHQDSWLTLLQLL